MNRYRTGQVTRRAVLKGAGSLLAVSALPRFARAAENQAPIGTGPAGAHGCSVFVGNTSPPTGTYAAQGEVELNGYKLAIELINTGHPLIKAFSPKTKKGVLGK